VPRDINLDSATKSALVGGESPKVDKPPSPQAEKSTLEPPKPPSPKGAQSPTGADGALTPPSRAASSHDAVGTSPRPEPAEFPEASPLSPQSYGLRVTSGPRPGEVSSVPQYGKQPR
jgi:hypothetical protein